jgi:hypothetical protein
MCRIKTAVAACIMLAFSSHAFPQKLNVSSINADQDKAAIKNVVNAYAKALMELPKTRDPESVLRFHMAGFTGIEDGKKYDLDTIKGALDKLIETAQKGRSLTVTVITGNIDVEFDGDAAWASYESEITLRVNDVLADETTQKCKQKYSRYGDRWMLSHAIITSAARKDKAGEAKPVAASSYSIETPTKTRIVDQVFNVAAGRFNWFNFHLDKQSTVTGRFDLTGNRSSDIYAYIINTVEFDNLRNNRLFRSWYMSGKVVSGSIYATLPPGNYLLVFSNTHSLVIGAEVRAVLDVTKY